MTTKDTMTITPRTVELALFMLGRELECYESNLRRKLYPDADQREYVEKLVVDLQQAVAELQAL
jgi:hypothetical protein